MTAPEGRWRFGLAFSPHEIEALRAGKRVTKTYPEAIPHEPPHLLPEDLEAMRRGEHVMKIFKPVRTLQAGDVVEVVPSDDASQPPPLRPGDLEAILAGTTVTTTGEVPTPAAPLPDLRVKVVDCQPREAGHVYTFEAVRPQ